jgi:hypothetical protein
MQRIKVPYSFIARANGVTYPAALSLLPSEYAQGMVSFAHLQRYPVYVSSPALLRSNMVPFVGLDT